MIVENFNFVGFLNLKNIMSTQALLSKGGGGAGLGAVSIITPKQAITRFNEPDKTYNITALGSHHETERNLAKEILALNKEGISIEKEELSNSIENFLNHVIRIHYASIVNSYDYALIKKSSSTNATMQQKISEEMYYGVEAILKQVEEAKIPARLIAVEGLPQSSFESYELLKQYFKERIDPNFISPFKEEIIAEQQCVQETDLEEER